MIEMRPAHALLLLLAASASARYHGREIGALSQLNHGVKGTVYAVDARTLFINDFHYDGVGPAAYFYVGTSGKPSANGGIRLRDERGNTNPLRKYRGEGVTVSLPDGLTLRDVKWFSVWCDDYAVNFGDVTIPRDLEYPKPAKVGALRGVHGVSSDPVVVVDAQTLLVPNFSYDGEAPDAKFWVGRGETPSPQGIRIPDENGKEAPLRKYDKKTIVLTLPGELTVFDIGHFAVWCEAFTVNFGHVPLPRAALSNVPPSLKMLGVSPQSRNSALVASSPQAPPRAPARAHRPKIAKLDATTYRPALALAAGPRASPDHRPAAHEHLHRRAYTHTSQHQLVQVQPSQELHYKHFDPQSQTDLYQIHQRQGQTENQQNFGNGETDPYQLHQGQQQSQNQENYRHEQDQTDLYQVYQGQKQSQAEQTQSQQNYKNQQREEDLYRQYQEQKQRLEELQRQYQQTQQNQGQDLYNQQQQSPQQYQQQSDQYLNQYQQREQQEQQSQLQYQQQEQHHQQQYTGDRAAYERQLYERQLVEQQRLAFEREAQHQRGPGDGEPFRYRLLPYSYEGSH